MAQKVTIDLANKLIIAKAGITTLDATIDLYSDLKEDWRTNVGGELAFEFPFDTTGGDSLPGGLKVGAYYLFRNDLGWRIRPDETDHELIITGNLYPITDASPMFAATVGAYTVSIQQNLSSLTQGVTEEQIATSVLDRLLTAHATAGSIGEKIAKGLTTGKFLGLK